MQGKFTAEYRRNGKLLRRLERSIPIVDNGVDHLLNVTFPTGCKTITVWPPTPKSKGKSDA